MKKLLKLASIAFYFLMFIAFFIIGLYVAGLLEVGKGQMLAGGAIVLGWGVMFAGVALIASFFIARYVSHKNIIRFNWILLAIIAIAYGISHYRYLEKQKEKETEKTEKVNPKRTTTSVNSSPTAMLSPLEAKKIENLNQNSQKEDDMGMGFFSPNYYEQPILYFYGNPNLEKGLTEHLPQDSITFKRNQYNQFEIATAPPWLVADHMKLDYDMLYFKIQSITEEFVEVLVNHHNGQTSFVNRRAGRVAYWPEFLLSVHSVEFYPNSEEKVRNRPFEASGVNNAAYEFMKPIRIKGEWMEVILMDSGYNKTGKGWIQWTRDGKLLVLYNLLS